MAETLYKGKPVSQIPLKTLQPGENVFVPFEAMSRDAVRRDARALGVEIRTVLGPYVGYFTVFLKPQKDDRPKRKYTLRAPEERKAAADQLRRRSERHAWHRRNAAAVEAMLAA